MKTYKTTIETITRKFTESHTCDRCGESLFEKMYEVSEVTIKTRSGSCYPEGSHVTEVEFDCCLKCFNDSVLPALKALRFHLRESDVEY